MAKKAVRKAAKPAAKKMKKKAAPAKAARKAAASTAKKAVKKAAPKKVAKKKAAPKKTVRAAPAVKDGRAEGYPQFTLSITVRDMQQSIAFYENAFGFKLDFSMPGPDGKMGHAQMTYFGGRIMFSPEGAFGGTVRAPATTGQESPMQSYAYCPDVDAFTAHARGAGAKVLAEPMDMFWGDRMVHLEDIDGYRWAFATNTGPFDPSKAPPH
jgi:uncharacterized glyoxalase superfamily protein PhnB